MGGVIDTSVIIACERKGWTAKRTISHLQQAFAGQMVLPSIAAAELIRGIYRAQSAQQADLRRIFVQEIFEAWPPMPFTEDTAWIAGEMRGQQAKAGNTLPLGDSLIAAAAIQLSFSVMTLNARDFDRIPNLGIIRFAQP